jgi:hypothetical protein
VGMSCDREGSDSHRWPPPGIFPRRHVRTLSSKALEGRSGGQDAAGPFSGQDAGFDGCTPVLAVPPCPAAAALWSCNMPLLQNGGWGLCASRLRAGQRSDWVDGPVHRRRTARTVPRRPS